MNDPEQAALQIGFDGEIESGLPVREGKTKRKRRSRLARATRRTTILGFWTTFILLSALGIATGIEVLKYMSNNGSRFGCHPYVDDLSAGNNMLLASVGNSYDLSQAHARLINIDGSDSKRLEGDFMQSRDLSLSPDGRYVIDSRFDTVTPKGELYLTDLTTMTRRHLRNGILPAWAWDSRRIAFVDGPGVYVMDIDGSNLKLVSDSTAVEFRPAWSPDGKTLAISFHQARAIDIYLVNLETSSRSILVNNGQYPGEIAWSPDGQYFAVLLGRDIVLFRPDGSTAYNVTNGGFAMLKYPVWLSDGKQLAFIGSKQAQAGRVYVANLDGSEIREVYAPRC
jgi:WD40 repeat protein